jgi:hypothetical protein
MKRTPKFWVDVQKGKFYRGPRPRDRRGKGDLKKLTVSEYQQLAQTKPHTWAVAETGKVVSQSIVVRRWEWFVGAAAIIAAGAGVVLSHPW